MMNVPFDCLILKKQKPDDGMQGRAMTLSPSVLTCFEQASNYGDPVARRVRRRHAIKPAAPTSVAAPAIGSGTYAIEL